MTIVIKDLTANTLYVPVIDKHSPITYSIILDFHWNNKIVKRRGIETMFRMISNFAFIIEGREILKKIKKSCERCRFLDKKTIDFAIGPVSQHNLKIAPAFNVSQVDLAGLMSINVDK